MIAPWRICTPFFNVNVLPLSTAYCRTFYGQHSKVRITSGKLPADSIAKQMLCMKDLLEISCGLDVHKDKIVARILTGSLGKPTHSEIQEFSTLIQDMITLRDWIVSQNWHHAAMETTGIYWMPIYEIRYSGACNRLLCRLVCPCSAGMGLPLSAANW